MPELPEAETIARGLERALRNRVIESVEIRRRSNVIAPWGMRVDRILEKETIAHVGRRGKYVVILLGSGRRLIVQLRMTGRLLVLRPGERPPPASHVVLWTRGGEGLAFADVRKLGRVRIAGRHEAWDEALGLEPLAPGFTVGAFTAMLAGRTTPVKVLLLDQRRIAGIGNIYACEALWEAGIRPTRPAKAVSRAAAQRLHRAIVDVLTRAIELRGSSIDDYVDADGDRGGFQDALRVYGKRGMPCPRCGRAIVRTVLAGRGTWWCRRCQR